MLYFIFTGFFERLSHMLVGIYSTEKNIMDVINAFHIEKTQEGRKNKQKVMEVEAARVGREHERRGRG
jgi:hypothetical protein